MYTAMASYISYITSLKLTTLEWVTTHVLILTRGMKEPSLSHALCWLGGDTEPISEGA